MSIVVFGTLRFSAEDLSKVAPHIRKLVDTTRQGDGCYCYDVAMDFFDPGLLRFSEVWPDQASLDAHFKSCHVAEWRKAIAEYTPEDRAFIAYEAQTPEYS